MPKRVFRRDGFVLGMDTTALDRAIARLETEGIQAAGDIVEDAVRAQYAIAYREWGVRSGKGRASIRIIRRNVDDAYVVRIYSEYRRIRWQSFSNKPPTFWAVLVARPLRKIAKRLAKLSAKQLAEAVIDGVEAPSGR